MIQFSNTLQIIILVSSFLKTVVCAENFKCELSSSSNFKDEPPLLSLRDLDIIYQLDLVLAKNSTLKIIKAIQIQPGCKLLTCSESKLKGKCMEYSSSLQYNLEQIVKSVACKCSSDSNSDIQKEKRTPRKLDHLDFALSHTGCGTLYQNWYYTGDSLSLEFMGSAGKLGLDTVNSVKVNDGCKITLWKQIDNKVLSINLEDSNTFINNNLSNVRFCFHVLL
jgi:hypothetical protein